jgi:ApeA N-terminal domain 1
MNPSFIPAWLRLRKELSVVCDLFLSTIYSDHMFLEHRFLNYVQAAEILHRKTMKTLVTPPHVHNGPGQSS